MANRFFFQLDQSLEKNVVTLFAVVKFGAAGAPTLQKWDPAARSYSAASATGFKGVKTITRTGTGVFDVVLQDSYNRFLSLNYTFENASASAAPFVVVQTPDTNLASTTTPKCSLTFLNTSSVATDPASGEIVILEIVLSNSTSF